MNSQKKRKKPRIIPLNLAALAFFPFLPVVTHVQPLTKTGPVHKQTGIPHCKQSFSSSADVFTPYYSCSAFSVHLLISTDLVIALGFIVWNCPALCCPLSVSFDQLCSLSRFWSLVNVVLMNERSLLWHTK